MGYNTSEIWQQVRDKLIGEMGSAVAGLNGPASGGPDDLERTRLLLDQTGEAIFLAEWPSGKVIDFNCAACDHTGLAPAELRLKYLDKLLGQASLKRVRRALVSQSQAGEPGAAWVESGLLRQADGGKRPVELTARLAPLGSQIYLVIVARDLLSRRQAEEALHSSEARFRLMAEEVSEGIMIIEQRQLVFINRRLCEMLGYSREEMRHMLPSHVAAPEGKDLGLYLDRIFTGDSLPRNEIEFWALRKDGQRMCLLLRITPIDPLPSPSGWYVVVTDVTERVYREREGQAIATMVKAMSLVLTQAELVEVILEQVCSLSSAERAALTLYYPEPAVTLAQPNLSPGQLPFTYKLPLFVQQENTGELCVGSGQPISEAELNTLRAMADLAAGSLQRMTMQEETQKRLQRLAALRSIDMTISSSLDLKVTLGILVNQVVTHLNVSAASVLLYRSRGQLLEYAASQGFRQSYMAHSSLHPLYDLAAQASLQRKIMHYTSQSEGWERSWRSSLLEQEGFVSYIAAPLVAKGEVKGILELFNRSPLNPDSEWMEFLEALAMQGAIAIDNSGLFEGLQRTNMELRLAYETTLEGWVRTLDLRDKETEDHTVRVTSLTQHLAMAMGINGQELLNIRRGALLHDIGKMALPDSILLKAGPLSEEEWVQMRMHPVHARELLADISYLRPALDIPYCHHEKWDGTGYPRHLKGEEIPIAARIFAIVDVWDALSSDRPYRQAWPREKVLEYIIDQAGKQFDPAVVDAFLKLLASTGSL